MYAARQQPTYDHKDVDRRVEKRVVEDEKDVLKAVVQLKWIQRGGAKNVPRRYGAGPGRHAGGLLGVPPRVVDMNMVLDWEELNACGSFSCSCTVI